MPAKASRTDDSTAAVIGCLSDLVDDHGVNANDENAVTLRAVPPQKP
jgi:hypothetical protein